jgi:acyl-coenzyme A synthetase/AMP-(fatty) acid ligase
MVAEHIEGLRGVKQLLAGGDVLSPASVRQVLEKFEDCVVINGYGPTECTTFTCCHRMSDARAVTEPVPIGRPITNTRVFILDRYERPVPIGAAGELYVGGDGLAQGYLNAPELTAKRFLQPPAGIETTGSLYRTGDRVRYRQDGTIEFLGRLDGQVKIRGFRVEPGEIEAVLGAHPSVLRAAAVAKDARDGGKRLNAYAVVSDRVDVSELRDFLKQRLPDHMVPMGLAIVKEFPLTPSGKIDRDALPEPPRENRVSGDPRTPAEDLLAGIWAELLGLEKVGVHEDFFGLGGHALLATRIASRVHAQLGVNLPLRAIFSAPTIAELAAVIDGLEKDGSSPQGAPLAPISRTARRLEKGVRKSA